MHLKSLHTFTVTLLGKGGEKDKKKKKTTYEPPQVFTICSPTDLKKKLQK